jgi:TATA-box binding protein (TBP) (component of TFIID and TFIIIB)
MSEFEIDNEWESFLNVDEDTECIDDIFTNTKQNYPEDSIQSFDLYKKTEKCNESTVMEMNDNTENENIPKCGEFYISTQTKILKLNQMIDINSLFWKIHILNYYKMKNGIIEKQIKLTTFNEEDSNKIDKLLKNEKHYTKQEINFIKNTNSKHRLKYKHVQKIIVGMSNKNIMYPKQLKKAFYNCISLVVRIKNNEDYKEFHIKLFNTGKVEIPGVQNSELMYKAIDYLISELNPFMKKPLKYKRDETINVISNSNFNCSFNIKRFALYEILKKKYNIICSYDPCSYPGIKSKFYYNKNKKIQDGICDCDEMCNKSDNSSDNNKCKEISFMIFSTGSVLIVGNCDENVLKLIYDYLKIIFRREYYNISNGVSQILKKKPNKKIKKKIIEVDV